MLVIDLQGQNNEWYREMLLIVFLRKLDNKNMATFITSVAMFFLKQFIIKPYDVN